MELDEFIELVKEQQGIDLSGVLTTADKIGRPERALEKQAIDDFMERNPMAGGGMLVQPSADGSRPGYAKDKKKVSANLPDKYGKFTGEGLKGMERVSDAILKAYADDDITYLFEKKEKNPKGLISAEDSKQGLFKRIKEDQSRIDFVVKNTGLDEDTIFDILDDRIAYLELEKERPTKPLTDKKIFLNKAEKWLMTNSKRYADPAKFEKAFIRTFGKDNLITKTIKANITDVRGKGRLGGFSDDFIKTIMATSQGVDPTRTSIAFDSRQLKEMFKTVIYNNNPNVRKRITTIFENILPEPGSKRTPDIRKLFENDPVLKKFGLDKSIKGPIARLILNEIGEDLFTNVRNFQKPFLGTDALLNYLKDRVDPKYKEMFREASNAVKQAQKNQWPQAKKSLNLSQSIMFDHKIPKSIIEKGYADEIEYIKLNPTSEKFNATIKRSQFDQPLLNLIDEFERSKTLDAKANVVTKMNKLKNDFSKKYGGYLDEVSINVDKTGKPIFTSSAPTVTKKTDLTSSLKKSLVQTGEAKKGSPLYKKLMKFCPKSNGGQAGVCTIDEAMKGLISESKQLQSGNMNEAQAKKTAQKIRAVTRVGTGSTLAGLLGPYGLAGEVVIDGAFMANRMLDGGDTYKEALSKSLIKYAMPKDARERLEKETDLNTMILGSDTSGLAADYADALKKDEDLKQKYENYLRVNQEDMSSLQDPYSSATTPMFSTGDKNKALRELMEALERSDPTYGKNIYDIMKFGSPEQQAFATKQEVFDAEKMQRRMDYDRKILGPLKDLFDTGFYSPAQLKQLELKADRDTKAIGESQYGMPPSQSSALQRFSDVAQLGVANLAKGGRAGYKTGSVRKGVLSLIDEGIKKTPKDTTTRLDKLIKETLNEDFFDKKDRIIDNLNARIAKAKEKGLDSEEIGKSQIEFYDNIIKSNFRTKTGPFFDYQKRKNKAGGGLLKQAGDRSGPPPESGPNSQGLQGLLNRGKNI